MNDIAKKIEGLNNQIIQVFGSYRTEDVALIPTSRGLGAIVDKQFEEDVLRHRWYANHSCSNFYAVADIEGKRVSLQRLILSLDTGKPTSEIKQVSFKNKLTLDCRLANLEDRVGRQAVMRNRRPKRNTSSKYKGVRRKTRRDGSSHWASQIKADIGQMSLGSYEDETFAAKVYDAAAFVLFKGAAFYNFPDSVPDLDALEIAIARIERFRLIKARNKPQT